MAGGNSNRMKELTHRRAAAAMPIAGSYRAIDFTLSNMSNSHIRKVAVLTQYNARSLNEHLNSSKWWDFGRKQGGLYVFTPTITIDNGYWYRGTSDAIYQNLDFLKSCHEPYVVIASGDAVYKLSTDENWSLVVPVEEELGVSLQEKGVVKIRFLKNQYESWANTKLIRGSDGNPFLQLDFNNSMVTFATDRYVDIELILNDEVGLKIPNSSIVQKDFYLVPGDYMTKGADGSDGVILERYNEEGNIYSEFLETSVYNYDEENKEYYLDSAALAIGSNIIKPDSQEKYTISRKASLTGVYNMNKGYADFRQINILYQNEEYAIVKSNTRYGLNVYDYIVLEAAAVNDAQFIY